MNNSLVDFPAIPWVLTYCSKREDVSTQTLKQVQISIPGADPSPGAAENMYFQLEPETAFSYTATNLVQLD